MKIKKLNLKKTVATFALTLVSISTINTQESSSNFWSQVQFGGGIGLSLGNGFFSGTIAPSALYNFNDYLATGLSLNATFNSRKDLYKSTILGGSIITLFNPLQEIQLSAELEELNVDRNYNEAFVSNIDDNYWYTALYFGAGYRTGNITFGIRYDVLYNENKSIYADPWLPFVRVYF